MIGSLVFSVSQNLWELVIPSKEWFLTKTIAAWKYTTLVAQREELNSYEEFLCRPKKLKTVKTISYAVSTVAI